MIHFNRLLILALITFFTASCGNEDVDPIDDNGNDSTYTQYGTPYDGIPETSDIVMYEVNLRAFSNTGDLQGVISRLDEIKALGVNVIWLMPIHPIGEINSVNSPYSVKDYLAVSSEYGSLDDLRQLTDMAHERDMAVIMDWIANHTAWDNPWIESQPNWYAQDQQGNIIHPPGTNWLDVAQLNFDNYNMRSAMIDAMKYWVLEANVDGFRCDYADGVPFDFWQQAIDSLRNIPQRELVMLAEGGRVNHLQAGFDINWAWDFYYRMIDVYDGQGAGVIFTTHLSEYNQVPAGKHRLRYTTNHDESAWDNTPMVLFNGKQGALAASVVTIYMGGVPLFYTGQEVGRLNNVMFFSNTPINWNENPDMLQEYKNIMGVYVESDAARRGAITNYSSPDVISFKRFVDDEELLVIVNVRNNTVDFQIPAELQDTQWMNTLTNQEINLNSSMGFSGYQYLILKR